MITPQKAASTHRVVLLLMPSLIPHAFAVKTVLEIKNKGKEVIKSAGNGPFITNGHFPAFSCVPYPSNKINFNT